MEQPPPTFTCFGLLAPELRLKIWEDALPEPRIIDLKLLAEPLSIYNPKPKIEYWVSTSPSINHEVLSKVNREARNVYFKSYRRTDILEQLGEFTRPVYIDFSRDILCRNCSIYDDFSSWWLPEIIRNILAGLNDEWVHETELLTLHPAALNTNSWIYNSMMVGMMKDHESRQRAVQCLLNILQEFPKLQHLRFIIDGRHNKSSGMHKIVEPSETFPDRFDNEHKDLALMAFADFLKHVKEQHPEVGLPKIELALIIDVEDNAEANWRRVWDYDNMICGFARQNSRAD